MFSRSALARVFALPLEQSTLRQPLLTTSFRACLHQTTSDTSSTHPEAPLSATPRAQILNSSEQQQKSSISPPSSPSSTHTKQPVEPTFDSPLKVTKSLLDMLPHLTSQGQHYITTHLHARPYLLTEGDQVRLPFLMPNVKPGDVLRFNRASSLGSRDFTLKGAPYIDERLFECRVRVMGVDSEPMRIKEKTKRRQRHVRKVRSKHRYTLLRVMDVKVKTVEQLLGEGAIVVDSDESGAQVEAKA